MTKAKRTKKQIAVLRPEGELTIYTAADNKARFLEALSVQDHLELDLSQVTEMDSAGLQLLLMAKKEAGRRNIELSFGQPSQVVMEVLDLCNLSSTFGSPVVIPFEATERRTRS